MCNDNIDAQITQNEEYHDDPVLAEEAFWERRDILLDGLSDE